MSYEIPQVRIGQTGNVPDHEIALQELERSLNSTIEMLNATPEYYTRSEIDELLENFEVEDGVTGLTQEQLDAVLNGYYTKTEVDELLAMLAPLDHNHNTFYYTKSQIDSMRSVPFYNADGSYDPIPLVGGMLPFFNADGSSDPIPVSV